MTKISTQVAQVQKVAKYTRPLQSNRHLPWCFLSFQWDPTTLGSGKPGHFIKLDRRKSSVLQRCFSVCFEGQATKTERLDDWWWLDILDLLPFAINRSSKCMCVCVCVQYRIHQFIVSISSLAILEISGPRAFIELRMAYSVRPLSKWMGWADVLAIPVLFNFTTLTHWFLQAVIVGGLTGYPQATENSKTTT